MRNKFTIFLIILFSVADAQNKSSIPMIVSLSSFYSKVPSFGISHYFYKDYTTGGIFTASEGISYYFSNKKLNITWDTTKFPNTSSNNNYFNRSSHGYSAEDFSKIYLWQIAEQSSINLNNVDLFLTFRKYWKDEIHRQSISQSNFFNLASTPFQIKYLKEPEVFLPIALAAGASLIGKSQDKTLFDAKSINIFGKDFQAPEGSTIKIFTDYVYFTLVAISEEMLFRGMLQTSISESVNPNFGLVVSSILFGLAHLPNHSWFYSLRAMVAGFYFGWQYQKYNNDLGRVIALHFQIDFLPVLISFFKSPSQSNGVYKVGY